MLLSRTFFIFVLALLTLSPFSIAQENLATIHTKNPYPIIHEPNWLNEQFLIKQRNHIDEITRRHFGQQLQIGLTNIPILQRIIDQELIPNSEKLELQALGVVLGDIFLKYDRTLVWKVYEDEEGKSHAVCINDTKHCLFPVTMLSRRIEAGAKVDVMKIYNKGISLIKPVLPKRPYSN